MNINALTGRISNCGKTLLLLAGMLFCSLSLASYDYPISDRYKATVVGTPPGLEPELPAHIPYKVKQLLIFPDRQLPDVFWYQASGLNWSLSEQKDPTAPLIFLIAGTGADFDSEKMLFLARAFYNNGFHVVSLGSPTEFNFLSSGSRNRVPGMPAADAEDLYRAMTIIKSELTEDDIQPRQYFLSGYSLGGMHSAFLAKIDSEKQQFNFSRTLIINPPVSLLNSVQRLDKLLSESLKGGVDDLDHWTNNILRKFAHIRAQSAPLNFNHAFIYNAINEFNPSEQQLKALIGVSFRLSLANMAFTSDYLNHSGFLIPADRQLAISDSTSAYFKKAMNLSWMDYMDRLLLPFYEQQTQFSREALIHQATLYAISDFLRKADNVAVVTNADDIILDSAEVKYLQQLFVDRIRVYPRGGHCGNMSYRQNTRHMLDYFNKAVL